MKGAETSKEMSTGLMREMETTTISVSTATKEACRCVLFAMEGRKCLNIGLDAGFRGGSLCGFILTKSARFCFYMDPYKHCSAQIETEL